jgi:hypothetical protein
VEGFGGHHLCLTPRAILENGEMWVRATCAMSPAVGPSLDSFHAEVGGYACVWLYG